MLMWKFINSLAESSPFLYNVYTHNVLDTQRIWLFYKSKHMLDLVNSECTSAQCILQENVCMINSNSFIRWEK